MDDAHGRGAYVEPTVSDFGDLVELTAFDHLLYGRARPDGRAGDLSFSGSVSGGGSTGAPGATTAAGTGNGPRIDGWHGRLRGVSPQRHRRDGHHAREQLARVRGGPAAAEGGLGGSGGAAGRRFEPSVHRLLARRGGPRSGPRW